MKRIVICIGNSVGHGWLLAALLLTGHVVPAQDRAGSDMGSSQTSSSEAAFPGMDEAVNGTLAEQAGRPPRDPYLDLESLGDLWNLILLMGGGISGFILGRNWDRVWGRAGHLPDNKNKP